MSATIAWAFFVLAGCRGASATTPAGELAPEVTFGEENTMHVAHSAEVEVGDPPSTLHVAWRTMRRRGTVFQDIPRGDGDLNSQTMAVLHAKRTEVDGLWFSYFHVSLLESKTGHEVHLRGFQPLDRSMRDGVERGRFQVCIEHFGLFGGFKDGVCPFVEIRADGGARVLSKEDSWAYDNNRGPF
jgi:hypothetical protein